MKIRFGCPSCNRSLAVDEKFRGRRISCPRCGVAVIADGKLVSEEAPSVPRKKAATVKASASSRRRDLDEDDELREEEDEERPRKKKKRRRSRGDSWFSQRTMAGWNILGLVLILLYLVQPAINFVLISKLQKAQPNLQISIQPIAGQIIASLIMIGIGVGLIAKLDGARKWFLILGGISLALTTLSNLANRNGNMGLVIGQLAGMLVVLVCGYLITAERATGLTVAITILPFLASLGVALFAFFYVLGLEPGQVMELIRSSA